MFIGQNWFYNINFFFFLIFLILYPHIPSLLFVFIISRIYWQKHIYSDVCVRSFDINIRIWTCRGLSSAFLKWLKYRGCQGLDDKWLVESRKNVPTHLIYCLTWLLKLNCTSIFHKKSYHWKNIIFMHTTYK